MQRRKKGGTYRESEVENKLEGEFAKLLEEQVAQHYKP